MSDTDIALLFAKDPLQHTEKDIDAIIAKMREQRHMFNSKPAASPKSKTPAPKVDLSQLDLGDL